MTVFSFVKAGILTLALVIISIASWEFYLRAKGIKPSYDDGESLWSDKRAMVYEPADKATVFIGSSRNKYDLDTDTWKAQTGEDAIQLAVEGTSPLPILHNLADDSGFKGKLMIDVTEGLFFSLFTPRGVMVKANLDYYKKITPAQQFSFKVNHLLESQLVFLDKDYLSLNGLLQNVKLAPRYGVYGPPDFPMEFNRVNFERQNKMTDRFLADSNLQNKVRNIWGNMAKGPRPPALTTAQQDSIFAIVKKDIEKIKSRGGQIIFVRTPSSGPFLEAEKKGFPREQYWDKLLAVTNCPGIHFEDYPAIAHFQCPEFSHLSPSDAIVFTRNLIQIVHEKGWVFPYAKPFNNFN